MAKLPVLLLVSVLVAAGAGSVVASHVQTSGGWSVSFTSKSGNEWWVEVVLGGPSASQATRVQAMDTGGAWTELTKRSWGAWAASFHVEPGNLVRFRAIFPDGAMVESCEFTHPAGVERCGGGGGGGNTTGFDATFSGVKGNEWWIQAKVAANAALAGVDARINGGAWQPLQLKSWGDWAASYRAPEGSIVQLRARASSGAEDLSGCYRWVSAAPVACGGGTDPGTFDASFRPRPGNQWWVEVYVDANRPLAGVDARVVGGTWHALSLRSWGAWAGSFHVPDGSRVEFRARATDGSSDVSGRYRWPSATPVGNETGVWPVEGSFVKYHVEDGTSVPGFSEWTIANVTMTYRNGAWNVACEGWTWTEVEWDDSSAQERMTASYVEPDGPPRGPTTAVQGEDAVMEILVDCGRSSLAGTTTAKEDVETTRRGQDVNATAWRIDFEPVWPQDVEAYWHVGTGLSLLWFNSMSRSYEHGYLVDTDAPIAKGDAPATPPAPTAWPFVGSYVNLRNDYVEENSSGHANVSLTFQDGFWQGVCDWHTWNVWEGDATGRVHVPYSPVTIRTNVSAGSVVRLPYWYVCDSWDSGEPIVVQGQYPEDVVVNGKTFRARVWWADEPEGDPDRDAWWDTKLGLMLRFEHTSWSRFAGRVTSTDAPLASW